MSKQDKYARAEARVERERALAQVAFDAFKDDLIRIRQLHRVVYLRAWTEYMAYFPEIGGNYVSRMLPEDAVAVIPAQPGERRYHIIRSDWLTHDTNIDRCLGRQAPLPDEYRVQLNPRDTKAFSLDLCTTADYLVECRQETLCLLAEYQCEIQAAVKGKRFKDLAALVAACPAKEN